MTNKITYQEMEKAVKAFRTEGVHTDYSNIITILMGIANDGNFDIYHKDTIMDIINDLNARIATAWTEGYENAEADMSEKVSEAYWQGYNEAKEQYDGTSDDDYEEPEDIDDDFGFDPYMGCYTYDC